MKNAEHHRNITRTIRSLYSIALNASLVALAVGSTQLSAASSPAVNANPLVAPASSMAYGMSYDQWENTYLQWVFGGSTIAPDANGNAVVNNAVLVPYLFPEFIGAHMETDVTMNSGQPFMMTMYGFVGYSYADGTPPDDFLPLSLYQTLDLRLTLDGVTLMDGSNLMQYFSQIPITPTIPGVGYDIIWFQGIGVVHAPLTPGAHTLRLDAKNTEPIPPNFGAPVFEVHNTWNVTVKAGK